MLLVSNLRDLFGNKKIVITSLFFLVCLFKEDAFQLANNDKSREIHPLHSTTYIFC